MADETNDEMGFNPETLVTLNEMTRNLYEELFLVDNAGSSPEAEQLFLLAMGSIDQGIRFLKLAQIKQSQALASR